MVIYDASFITFALIAFSLSTVPFYIYCTWKNSNEWTEKLSIIIPVVILWWLLMLWVNLSWITANFPADWATGPLLFLVIWILWWYLPRKRLVWKWLNQRWLVWLQLYRVIWWFFLIELSRGNMPWQFAYPAWFGDIATALIAAYMLFRYKWEEFPKWGIVFLAVFGILDFVSAVSFWVTTSIWVIPTSIENLVWQFPTWMIPFYLMSVAIGFHILSLTEMKRASWNN